MVVVIVLKFLNIPSCLPFLHFYLKSLILCLGYSIKALLISPWPCMVNFCIKCSFVTWELSKLMSKNEIHDFWVESAKLSCVRITTSCFGRTKAPVPIIWNTSMHGMLLFYLYSFRTYYQQELSSVSFKMACLLQMPLTQPMKKQSRVWYIQYAFFYANYLYTIMFLLDLDQLKCKKQLRTLSTVLWSTCLRVFWTLIVDVCTRFPFRWGFTHEKLATWKK